MRRIRSEVAGLVSLLALVLSGTASAAVSFSGQPVGFQPGPGFGVDAAGIEKYPAPLPRAGEPLSGGQGGTLLDVVFQSNATPVSFVIPTVGASLTGVFGTVQLRERFIDADEHDGLSLTASIDFGLPAVGVVNVLGTVTAIPGIVPPLLGESSGTIDLTIAWQSIDVPFGDGGRFRISLDTLNFDHVVLPPLGDGTLTLVQRATVTLLAAPVPEPSKWALVLMGVIVVGLYSRRRLGRQSATQAAF